MASKELQACSLADKPHHHHIDQVYRVRKFIITKLQVCHLYKPRSAYRSLKLLYIILSRGRVCFSFISSLFLRVQATLVDAQPVALHSSGLCGLLPLDEAPPQQRPLCEGPA